MKRQSASFVVWLVCLAGIIVLAGACSPPKPEPVKTGTIADGEMDPAKWGQVYPLEYDSWLKTKDPKPAGKSRYKKGWDTDLVVYDKLSEFPYMALLFNGWGFGIEYNEPRGHHYMLIDQLEIDPSRLKAGGVCLSCKSPYAPKLEKEMGLNYFKDPYLDVHAKIPAAYQKLGVSCADCHDNKTMGLKLTHPVAIKAFDGIGMPQDKMTRQEMRSAVCGQCHVTYVINKDKDMKSVGLFFPWQGSKPGDISVENIIKVIKSDPAHLEWKQGVTGFKVGFIRHPEYEFFTREQHPLSGRGVLRRLPHALHPGGSQQDLQPRRHEPPEERHAGLPAVPQRVVPMAQGPGLCHSGPHRLIDEPVRLRPGGVRQAL